MKCRGALLFFMKNCQRNVITYIIQSP